MKPLLVASAALFVVLILGCQQSAPAPRPVDPTGAGAARSLPPDEPANPPYSSVRHMMRAKLAHAQAVLEGVATNDMKQVEANANALIKLSQLSDWEVYRTMEYGLYSEDFRWNAKELARHAGEKKLHAATLDYMQLTMTCVRCHDYMSQAGLVNFDLKSLQAAAE